MMLTGWAAGYTEELLAPLGGCWAHVQGVVRQANEIAAILPAEERERLVAAAYLHDLGYAPALVETELHALDGARHLRGLAHERLAGLVASHSGAQGEAELRGLADELAEFITRPRPRRWRSPTAT
jgi:HD superfamily phosphodiesterase